MVKVKTSIRVEKKLWDEAKIYCIHYNLKIQDFVESAIRDKLAKGK